jgi:hypothetical protein
MDLLVVRPARSGVRRSRVYDRTVLAFAVILLFANAIFNAIAWPRFYPRIAADPRARDDDGRRTAFYTVHVVLIVIALVLAAASAITGVVILL